jgi:hypothetical protein
MPVSKHQLAASAYHIRPADLRKLLLAATNFRDRSLIKTLWWLGIRRSELIQLDVHDLEVERKRVTVHLESKQLPQRRQCDLGHIGFSSPLPATISPHQQPLVACMQMQTLQDHGHRA